MKNEQKAEIAKALFLMTDKTQKEICSVVGWSEKTFTEQKQKGNWHQLRDSRALSKQQIISLLHVQTLKIVELSKDEDRLLTSKEIDSIAKLASAIDKLEKKATLETFIQVFEEYNRWLLVVNPSLAQMNNSFQDLFISSKINNESK